MWQLENWGWQLMNLMQRVQWYANNVHLSSCCIRNPAEIKCSVWDNCILVLTISALVTHIYSKGIQPRLNYFSHYPSPPYPLALWSVHFSSWGKLQCWLKSSGFYLSFLLSLCSVTVCRHESGRCRSFSPFFKLFFLSFHLSRFSF